LELRRTLPAKTGKDDLVCAGVLEEAAAFVPIPNAGGRYSTWVLPVPDRVFEVRRKIADAIETLRGR
jgi:hypothetical protein